MSYQVLARKWRPKTFREMVGQEHVLKALINALDHNRLHHAYLFTGTRGVGKTTIARILAKCLNCEQGVSSEPCGRCSACLSINEGRFVDLIEVDAASRTKVEDTRELLENVQYAPTLGRYKVYLIDEVHMLSSHSFNALLKTLEEPPPHVKFLLATTDPQKLPATILSRCLQFNLKNMSPESIVGHLQHVLDQEMVSHELAALWLLGRAADGSMRDALSLTDQAIAYGSGKLSQADVRNMLGTIDQSAVFVIIEALAQADGAQLLAAVQQLSEHAPDYSFALEELLMLLHRIAVAQAVPDAADNSFGDREKIVDWAARMTAEDVQLFYQLGLNGRRDLPLAPDARSGFEMTLLRMLAFKPVGIPELPKAGLNNGGGVAVSTKVDKAAGVPEPAKKPEPAIAAPAAMVRTATLNEEGADTHSQPVPTRTGEQRVVEDGVGDVVKEVAVHSQAITLLELTPSSWIARFEELGFAGVVGNIASHCVLDRVSGEQVHLLLDENNATLFNDNYRVRMQEQLATALNTPLTVQISVQKLASETPAQRKQRLAAERKQRAIDSLQDDPNIQLLATDFGGVLDTESVQPV
jgi:DNA polymerase-3 subunit gamma/tau